MKNNCYLIEYNDLNSEYPIEIFTTKVYEDNLFSAIKKFHKDESNGLIINIYKKIFDISTIKE